MLLTIPTAPFSAETDDVPSVLSRIAAIKAQIQAERAQGQQLGTVSATSVTGNILQRATLHQQKASDTRLNLSWPLSQHLQNNSKGKQVLAERAAARKAAQQKSDVRIDALLFRIPSCKTWKGNAKTRMEQARIYSLQE